ncbi:nucleoside triphosphate pyrophosphohydrolase [Nitriliruptoraceae bacterium ZYF776]|nr:nucleoside triphosphate pyrophosphohydrolase [Profundirhabdus halotolerans]
MSDAAPRVVLVETDPNLPGLLPFQAWDALGTADEVLLRDPDTHPSAVHLHFAGLDLVALEPAALERDDLDLTRPGDPTDRRLAKALVRRAAERGTVVYLLGPDDERLAPVVGGEAQASGTEVELVFLAQLPGGTQVLRLAEVMRRLRDPEDGCPWDLEQDHASLVRYLVEETFEVVDAIESGTDEDLVEELGDVLLQVVFHAQVASDRRAFGLDDVARGIADKLERRHPHVFGDGDASTAAEVQANWDQLKAAEKQRTGPFDGVPGALPGLELLGTLQRKAAKRGFAWDDLAGPLAKVRAELDEVLAAADADDPGALEAEVGDLLGAVVALARALDVDPERAARVAARTFRARIETAMQLAADRGLDTDHLDAATWSELWDAAKDVLGGDGEAAR